MSYIFRLHKSGDNTITDWGASQKYGSAVIEQIQDPNGDTSKKEITSIPSPFARVDLVKTAFRKVAEMGVEGNTMHHKLVSDALDVAQIFFEYDKFKDKIDIIVWEKNKCIDELKNSPFDSHKQLGDVIDTYIKQDGAVYNFDKMDRMYILNYKHGSSGELNVLGATSPATLFFTPANDLTECKFGSGNDIFFDDDLRPLYRRDVDFQVFLYSLRKATVGFATLFPEVEKYMVESLKLMSPETRNKINNLIATDYLNNFDSIPINNNAGNTVFIINGMEYRTRRPNPLMITEVSGFVIKSDSMPDATIDGKKPLILPVDTYTLNTIYTQEPWNSHTKVPRINNIPPKERALPDDGAKYPYLTMGDFLTDTIVKMPYEIDKANYFDGNIDAANGCSYLLPLTDRFFQFFTVKDLKEKVMSDGKKMFELVNNASGVTVVLRIPIRRSYIEYRHIYTKDASEDDKRDYKFGGIVENKIGLGIIPFVKFPDNVDKHYRVAFYDKTKASNVRLTYMDGETIVPSSDVVSCKKDTSLNICGHETYVVQDNFDRIKVEFGDSVKGYIIPLFPEKGGQRQYTFAVDYGTTNTHIEYCTDSNRTPVMFDIKENEVQLRKLHKQYTDRDINSGFVEDFIPDTIGNNVYSFPMRTVFAPNVSINYNTNPVAMADGRIPFLYEKRYIPTWNDVKTEMKWGGVPDGLLKMHIETIFILLRNKVVLNNGNLADTKIIWFYPASMTEDKVIKFKSFWNEAYVKYFGQNTANIVNVSESVAPYCHFIETQGAANETVTIDVGGGTTDVLVVQNAEPKMLMSFRYASNAIFGDSYNSSPSQNGFVKTYLKAFENVLKDNNMLELTQALKQIEDTHKSSDIITFLFSLQGEKVKNNDQLDFLKKLQKDDKLRYVFIIFYSSIVYFIAKTMKAKGLKKPKTVAFSGNGARTLSILSTDNDMISRFVKLIFDTVYDNYDGAIEVKMEKNPKIATCKGGIQSIYGTAGEKMKTYDDIDNLKEIVVGDNLVSDIDRRLTYGQITEDLRKAVVSSVEEFFTFLFDMHRNNREFLTTKLGADGASLNIVKDFCLGSEGKQVLEDALSKGYNKKFKEVNEEKDKALEDTLFFYPLVGLLHDLAWKLSH